jgi:hypothetical protein
MLIDKAMLIAKHCHIPIGRALTESFQDREKTVPSLNRECNNSIHASECFYLSSKTSLEKKQVKIKMVYKFMQIRLDISMVSKYSSKPHLLKALDTSTAFIAIVQLHTSSFFSIA